MADPAPVAGTTVDDLAERVKKPATEKRVIDAFNTATEMVALAIGQAWRPVPDSIAKECVLSVGYAVYDRSKSSDGRGQPVTVESTNTAVRSPRDPMASIRTILADYVDTFA